VPAGEGGLDAGLAGEQPVHGAVHVVGRRLCDAQVLGERGRLPPARRGQLGSRPARPCHHERERQVPLGAGRAQDLGQAELPGHCPNRGYVAVGQAAFYGHGLARADEGFAREHPPEGLDRLGGQGREVREGLMVDLAALTEGPPQQEAHVLPVLVLAHDLGDVHSLRMACHRHILHPWHSYIKFFYWLH
jgi:hypothetical protein